MIIRFTILCSCLLVTSGCGRHRPEWPPPIDPAIYADAIPEAVHGSVATVGVAGVRAADGGVYIDLALNFGSPADEKGARSECRMLGFLLSKHDNPNDFIALELGDPIRLMTMERPARLFPSHIRYADPPTYSLGNGRFIQVCIFRTDRTIRSGQTARVRLTEAWKDPFVYGERVALPVTYEWRIVTVE